MTDSSQTKNVSTSESDLIRLILKAVLLKIIPASSLQYLIKLLHLWQRRN